MSNIYGIKDYGNRENSGNYQQMESNKPIHMFELLFRYETTGIRPEHLRDAMPLRQVQRRIQDFLCNGEPMWKIRSPKSGKARILVGHGLDHDLDRMQVEYPAIMLRLKFKEC